MTWQPINEGALGDLISESRDSMDLPLLRLWDQIKIDPQKWQLPPWGDLGGGFWAVAIIGNTVIWYNDIEEGFNRSKYMIHGYINEYWCNQDELQWQVGHVLSDLNDGRRSGQSCGPPQPL